MSNSGYHKRARRAKRSIFSAEICLGLVPVVTRPSARLITTAIARRSPYVPCSPSFLPMLLNVAGAPAAPAAEVALYLGVGVSV